MEKTTCQICEREIKANTGVIAHHGYQRPDRGSGWQTESCMGARHLPYEKSCDVIQPTIDYIEKYVKSQSVRIKEIMKSPPEKLYSSFMSWGQTPKEYPRPEGFDSKKCLEIVGYGMGQRYEMEFSSMYRDINRSIENGKYDIKRLKRRLVEWKLQ